jgi:ketosteroid isomerase-like protein
LTRMPGSTTDRSGPRYTFLKAAWAFAAVAALLACAVPVSTAMTPAQKHESRHEIDQLEDDWRKANLSSDTKAMEALLAADYVGIGADGTIENKDQTLTRLRSRIAHVTSLTISERKVRFYEKTAVVTSLAEVEGDVEGKDVTGSYRYTLVFIRNEQGVWKIVSFEASRIREPGPGHKSEFH